MKRRRYAYTSSTSESERRLKGMAACGAFNAPQKLMTACGTSNPMISVNSSREDREWCDQDIQEQTEWQDPVFTSTHTAHHCKPDLDNAISTFIVHDKEDGLCVRSGPGIMLAQLFEILGDSHPYAELYGAWCSGKLLVRRRPVWVSPVAVLSRVACPSSRFIVGLPFIQDSGKSLGGSWVDLGWMWLWQEPPQLHPRSWEDPG